MDFPLKGNYFNGQFTMPPIGGAKGVEQIIKKVSLANTEHHLWDGPVDFRHVEPVVESAEQGRVVLAKLTIEKRIELVQRLHEQIVSNKSLFENALSLETGKPLYDAHNEVETLLEQIQYLIKLYIIAD